MSAIVDAAKTGDLDAVKRLIADDPSLAGACDANGESPVMAALYRGHKKVADALIAAGAPVDLFAAAAAGRLEALEQALQSAPARLNDYAYDGWTALHLAAFFGHARVAERLLDAGADVNAVSRNALKNTPLHAASAGKHSDVALLLIARGADLQAVDAGRLTPFHIAAENGLEEVVTALVAAGADAHAVDAEEKTPLSRAAARNLDRIVDLINDPE